MKRLLLALLLGALPPLMACPGRPENPPLDRLKPTLGSIQTEIFNVSCLGSKCHGGPRPESRLSLVPGASYRSLVNTPSAEIADLMLVSPGHPGDSYLIRKLEGSRIVGEVMPLGRKRLPPEAIAVVREWIEDGAPP